MAENAGIDVKKNEDQGIVVEEAPKRVVAADEGIEGLKKQLEAEKSRREAAERQAHESATAVHRAKAEVDDLQLITVNNAIEHIKSHTGSLRNAYVAAMAKGDYTQAADIQLEMASNQAKLLQLETGQQSMTERPKTRPPVADPVEAFAAGRTPRTAAWIRAHPECVTDGRLHRKMIRAHEDAVEDGIPLDTNEYFAAVEARLGLNKPVEDDPDEDGGEHAAKPIARRSSPAAAPVSRSSPSSSGNPRVIRLSADEREMARLNKLTDQEYWEQKQRIVRDARYN